MRIALVNPPNTHAGGYEEENAAPPLGLCYIAAVLRQAGHVADLFDFAEASAEDSSLLERVGFFGYELYGFTAYTKSFLAALALLRMLRRRDSQAVVVFGGPHASPCAEELLQQYPEIDLVIRNEGEIPMVELARALTAHQPVRCDAADLTGVPNLVFRRQRSGKYPGPGASTSAEIVFNAAPSSLPALDDLPPPARDFRLEPSRIAREHQRHLKPVEVAYLSSSRGCPKRCSFCSIVVMSPKYRFRSVPSLMAEIQSLYAQRPFGHVNFLDANFFVHVQRTLQFSRALHEWNSNVTWSGTATADTIVKHAEILVEIGSKNCSFLEVGIESGNAGSLSRFNKWTTVEQNREAIRLLKNAGIGLALDFIMFEPEMTLQDLRQNLSFLHETELFGYSPPECLYNQMRLYPATPARERYIQMFGLKSSHLMALTAPFVDQRVEAVIRLVQEYQRRYQARITQSILELQRKWRRGVSSATPLELRAGQQRIAVIIRLQHDPYRFFTAALEAAEYGRLDPKTRFEDLAEQLGLSRTESLLAEADALAADCEHRSLAALTTQESATRDAPGDHAMADAHTDLRTCFAAAPDVLTVEEHQSVYLIPRLMAPLRLNQSASSIWKLLLRGEPLQQVLARYAQAYACTQEEARGDVLPLIEGLMSSGILIARREDSHVT